MRDQQDDSLAMPEALRALASIVLGDMTLHAVLQRTCDVTAASVPGAQEVSVTLIEGDGPRTAAFSGERALAVDESQYAAGHGPCLDAARLRELILVEDLRGETRWPDYVPAALEAGVRASLSVPLQVDDGVIGALNIYSPEPRAFASDGINVALDLARYAGIVLTNADHFYRATTLAEQMRHAMQSRAVIEQAKGILMAQRQCSADEAFDILVRLSQQSHRKLREVAQALVDATIEK
ncbi:MAG: ANTAR domain-containing protein [Frankiaceae bacterium]